MATPLKNAVVDDGSFSEVLVPYEVSADAVQPVIYVATDHAGFDLKEALVPYVRDELGYVVEDCGAKALDPLDDFPDFIKTAAAAVATDPRHRRAIIFGGSGQGEAMCANRYKGVRAAVYYGGPKEIVTLSREHNDANVLSIGARFVSVDEMKTVVQAWLDTTPLHDEKYHRRNVKIDT